MPKNLNGTRVGLEDRGRPQKLGRREFKHGDAKDWLEGMRRKYDLILTSPGYNVEKEYETKTTIKSYLKEQKQIIKLLVKRLSDRGSLCWQVGNHVDRKSGEVFPLDVYYYKIFKKLGLKLKNRIVWRFEHGLHAQTKFSGRYETILWFVKGEDYVFNLDNVRIKQKYPGKKGYKGKKKGKFTGNPLGKNPSDVWDIARTEWDTGIWEIPNVKANHKEKTMHPCQFPIELAERCILALTNEGGWVLDPFMGVGSTVVAAMMNNRNAVGIEKYKRYIKKAERRVQQLRDGTLPYRELGTPVLVPDPKKMGVARKPAHFR